MKVLMCGDRDWLKKESSLVFHEVFQELIRKHGKKNLFIISGGARGADTLAILWARIFGIAYHEEKAEWEKYGKAAGPIRNKKMLDMEPDLVIAFHTDIENSKGTKNCIEQAKKRGMEVWLVDTIK